MNILKDIPRTFLVAFAVMFLIGIAGGFLAVTQDTGSTQASAQSCEGYCVDLTEEAAYPVSVAVPVGEYVQFNTKDDKVHNLIVNAAADAHGGEAHGGAHSDDTADKDHHDVPEGALQSDHFGRNEAWRVQFKQAGTFRITDIHNENIDIVVVAYTPGGDYSIQ